MDERQIHLCITPVLRPFVLTLFVLFSPLQSFFFLSLPSLLPPGLPVGLRPGLEPDGGEAGRAKRSRTLSAMSGLTGFLADSLVGAGAGPDGGGDGLAAAGVC